MLEFIKTRFGGDEDRRTDGGRETAPDGSAAARRTKGPETTTAGRSGPSVRATGPDGQTVGLDQIFGILQNRRRRHVLRYLGDVEWVTLSELAEQIAARECDKDVDQLDSQERKRAYVGLYQSHLPKMAEVDAITYDRDRGTIERGPRFDLFVDHLPDENVTDAALPAGSRWVQYVTRVLKRGH